MLQDDYYISIEKCCQKSAQLEKMIDSIRTSIEKLDVIVQLFENDVYSTTTRKFVTTENS